MYMLNSIKDGELYIGSTNDLRRRFKEHNAGLVYSTKHRKPFKLVYYESCDDAYSAISREKQIKGGSRDKKVKLIESINKSWRDLYSDL